MNALVGKFGSLSLEQTVYLNAIARAWLMAPKESWAERMLHKTLSTECERFGVPLNWVCDTVPDSVKSIDDELPEPA